MTERGKRAPRKPSAALTAALAQIAALQLENLTIGDLKEKVAALEHDVERKWQRKSNCAPGSPSWNPGSHRLRPRWRNGGEGVSRTRICCTLRRVRSLGLT